MDVSGIRVLAFCIVCTVFLHFSFMYEVCSNSIRIGIVVAAHWVGCVCSQTSHVHTYIHTYS